ncbi:MAG: hypothetical protein OXI67_05445 [Candidatus Poribacteria bacterium]|nr:hypothetical protein [Candidatus Poribacteria bacterium]
MVRIIIGPEIIKKEGLDRVTKSLVKQIHRLTNEEHCEILFLTGVTKGDIHFLMRHILRVLDMPLTIMTQADPDNIKDSDELEITIRVT